MGVNNLHTAALYIRVSTDDQTEYSPDAQERLLRDYATRNDIMVLNEFIFIEEGISGTKADKRPEFQHMIGLAKSSEHPFDVILVWKYSRFARNQEESIVYKSLLKKNSVDVISISETVDGPFGSLIERIIEWMDEYYSIRLSEEVKRGMTEKALRGEYQTGAPFGYILRDRKLIINEEQAVFVRKIYDLYLNHSYNHFSIARTINDMGARTIRGNLFENRTVKYIIQNPIYKGYVRWNPNTKADLRFQKNHTDEIIVKKGNHEPIISEKVWEDANSRLLREYRPRKSKPNNTLSHWLGGILICSNCNSTLVSAGTHLGFQCHSYSKGSCKVSHYISHRKIEAAVLNNLKLLAETGNFDYEMLVVDDSVGSLEILNKNLEKLNIKEARIKDAYINGIDTIEEYKLNKERINLEKSTLETHINNLKQEKKSNKTKNIMISRLNQVCDVLSSDFDIEKKSNAIRSVVKKIIYNKKLEHIDIYLYYS